MMGKTKDSAQSLSKLIREKVKLRKIYLARVAGRFPLPIAPSPID